MRKYTKSHEWIEVEGKIATIGITKEAREEMGEIVHLELPEEGSTIEAGSVAVVLESTKAAVDISSPLRGRVQKVNSELRSSIGRLNESPEKEGWLFQLELETLAGLDSFSDNKG